MCGFQSFTFDAEPNQEMYMVHRPAGMQSFVDYATMTAARAAAAAADAAAGIVGPATGAGAHALRSASSVKALSIVASGRYDIEGLQQADVEARSSPAWKRFDGFLAA